MSGVYPDPSTENAGPLDITLKTSAGTELLGQQTLAASIPVAISSNQSVIPINDNSGSLTVDGTVAVTQSTSPWVSNITQISGSAITLGTKIASTSLPVTTSADVTYACSTSATMAANPTDVVTIYGSATKTIRVRAVTVSGTNTGNTNAVVRLVKRSAINTGGTSAAGTNVPMDSTSAAATAAVLSYTANPAALGATVGVVRQRFIFLPALASTNVGQDQKFTFSDLSTEALTLRSTTEGLAVNFNGVAIGGTSVAVVTIEWTES